ncbi:MAG: hypothetical protein KJ706_02185 [Candidatus Omnitrophica bacterium]|nr:hypothetical protein [Candidatus Omnitrophota bacterium]
MVALTGPNLEIRKEAVDDLYLISLSEEVKTEECRFRAIDYLKTISVKTKERELKEEAISTLTTNIKKQNLSLSQKKKALYNLQEIVTGNSIDMGNDIHSGKGDEDTQLIVIDDLYNTSSIESGVIKDSIFSFFMDILGDDSLEHLWSETGRALSIYMSSSVEHLEKCAIIWSNNKQDYFVTDIGFRPRDVWYIYRSDFVKDNSANEKERLDLAFSIERCLSSHNKEMKAGNTNMIGNFILDELNAFKKKEILSGNTGYLVIVYDDSNELSEYFKSEAEGFRDMAIASGVKPWKIKIANTRKDAIKAIKSGRNEAKDKPFFLAFFNHGARGAEEDSLSIERFSLKEDITVDDISQALSYSGNEKTGNVIIYSDACTSEEINNAILHSLDNIRSKKVKTKPMDIFINSAAVAQLGYVKRHFNALKYVFDTKFKDKEYRDAWVFSQRDWIWRVGERIWMVAPKFETQPLLGEDILKTGLILFNMHSDKSTKGNIQKQGVLVRLNENRQKELERLLDKCEDRKEKPKKPRVRQYGKYPDTKLVPGTLKITQTKSKHEILAATSEKFVDEEKRLLTQINKIQTEMANLPNSLPGKKRNKMKKKYRRQIKSLHQEAIDTENTRVEVMNTMLVVLDNSIFERLQEIKALGIYP